MVNSDRAAQVAAQFRQRTAGLPLAQLSEACVEALHVSGAGLTLMTRRNSLLVSSSDGRSGALDELQFSLGEGPSPDAFAHQAPVVEPDLEHGAGDRWPTFTPPALETGTRGVFALPLNAGTRVIGVLTLYRDTAGALTGRQADDSLIVADVVAQTMLSRQALSPSGVLAEELSTDGVHRAEVHQASGMVAVQLGIDVTDALARIRAHSYATDRSVADVAADIVARRLRLDGTDS